jgi:hypothetical protein
VERQDWVELGSLVAGEHLWTEDGPVEILATQPLTSGESVYNLEIHGHHVYQVAELGVLVHNSSLDNYRAPKELTAREIKAARQRGVNQAKAAERDLIQNGHPGTANEGGFTFAERKQIAETGQYPSDVRWHHINDVKRNPELADVPNNVIPSRGGAAGHVQNFHPNGTRAGSSGPLLDREALKNRHLNGDE